MPTKAMGEASDPRKAGGVRPTGCCSRRAHYVREDRMMLGYQCAESQMTIAVAADHHLDTVDDVRGDPRRERGPRQDDLPGRGPRGQHGAPREAGQLPHVTRACPVRELSDRCRPHPRPGRPPPPSTDYLAEQRAWYDRFWATSDVEVDGADRRASSRRSGGTSSPSPRPAARADAAGSARPRGSPAPATRATTSGTPRSTSLPFLTYTQPDVARNLLRFRYPDAARGADARTRDGQRGALFPWRTINGEEASAYYAAGTAQYHIDADIALRPDAVRRRQRRRRVPRARRRRRSSSRPPGCGPTWASGAATVGAPTSTSTG